jgi:hypothetical protein
MSAHAQAFDHGAASTEFFAPQEREDTGYKVAISKGEKSQTNNIFLCHVTWLVLFFNKHGNFT